MPHRLPRLLDDPAPAAGPSWLTGARLFDGTSAPARERVSLPVIRISSSALLGTRLGAPVAGTSLARDPAEPKAA